MTKYSSNNKRIAKNTLLLYFRMLLLMLVSLYTTRVIINALGVNNFGIYSAVGGVVAMFSILSGSLSSAISRFLTIEIGRDNKQKLSLVFSTSVTIQIGISVLIVLLVEPIGIWFLNQKMVIPEDRLFAANVVLQCSIITFVINQISVPYNAEIVAHEKMSIFAYITGLEAFAKLLIAYLVAISPFDKLIVYSLSLTIIALIIRFIYGFYCKKHFKECAYHFVLDKSLLKEMSSFVGWNMIGVSSAICRDHGVNILINLFGGPVVNAARGIAFQIMGALNGFVHNFLTALNPQLMKSFATNDFKYMEILVFSGARFSYYMLFLISLPILINTHYVLLLWLGSVPEHSVLFVRLAILFALSESLSYTLITTMLSTGKIRNYQIVVGGLQILNLPLCYISLKCGAIPESVMIIAIIISQSCLMARLYMLKHLINVKLFFQHVYINIGVISIIAVILPLFLYTSLSECFFSFLIISLACILSTLLTIYFIGCNTKERLFIIDRSKSLFSKIKS